MSDPRLSALTEIAERAADSARASDFGAIVQRGRRRRVRVSIAASVGAVLVGGVTVVGIRGVSADQSAPFRPVEPSPSIHTSTVPSVDIPIGQLTAQQIVASPRAQLLQLAVSVFDPKIRASMWRVCVKPSCDRAVAAVAVTNDGFAHASYAKVSVTSGVTWVGDEWVVQRHPESLDLLRVDGTVSPLTLAAQASPLRANESLVTRRSDVGLTPFGVDPFTHRAHPVPMPGGGAEMPLTRVGNETLWGVEVGGAGVQLSTDGGATWHQPYGGVRPIRTTAISASADPAVLAYALSSDSRSRRLEGFVRSTDGGATWNAVAPLTQIPGLFDWSAVTSDGRLLVAVDPSVFTETTTTVIYESDGPDWTSFHEVLPQFLENSPFGPLDSRLIATVTTQGGGQQLFAAFDGVVFVSTDDARTWAPTRAR